MKKFIFRVLLAIVLMSSWPVNGKTKEKVLEILYYKNIFGNLHQAPHKYSETISTISCGRTVKVLKFHKKGWYRVKVGSYTGYIQKDFLDNRRRNCFQDKYPRFFDKFKLDVSERYYWARLYDLYARGRSRVK